ncbi:MAG: hypothetical protein FD123_3608 [Bacteroidetes bacterium]|nr:MAG: hypothetical protein FD123_3608 [Bacteroidota bacterium]
MKKIAALLVLAIAVFISSCGGKQGPPPEKMQKLAKLSDTLFPAYQKLRDLQVMQLQAEQTADAWTINKYETGSKQTLRDIVATGYPALKSALTGLSAGWNTSRKNQLNTLLLTQDSCMTTFGDIMAALPDSGSYDDSDLRFQVRMVMADDNSEQNRRFDRASAQLKKLLAEIEPELMNTFSELKPGKRPE